MSKLFKSYTIKPILTIESLTYGIGLQSNLYYIFIRKRKCQWRKAHGPFRYKQLAENYIQQIKEEYNAVKSKHPT